jgi:hypothetical protein
MTTGIMRKTHNYEKKFGISDEHGVFAYSDVLVTTKLILATKPGKIEKNSSEFHLIFSVKAGFHAFLCTRSNTVCTTNRQSR